MEELQVRPGDVLAQKYRVEKVLGAGGMGVVVSARHVALGNLVAIKLMQPRAVAVKGAVERFLREGQAAAVLQSKHVTKVIDVGQLESGGPYMIMEHLTGGDLAHLVEKKGAVPLADAAEYLLQACDAIGEAHSKGIVHRDLKPANLFLQTEPDGTPLIKVLDFGIAKISSAEQGLTGTSQGMGSGGYMSPEQMSSAKKVDHRADIWALGVTLYELVTAHRPFEADSLEQFVTRVFWEEPTPLSAHRPDLPRELEAIILRCLDKQPDARFSSVAHFAQLIAPYAHPRAHGYVGRIAKMLGVDAPHLSQTNPGMQAPASLPAGPGPTAFGPAPQVAVAVAAPSQPAFAAQPAPPQPAPPQPAPAQPAVQPAPYHRTAPQTGPHPLSASQSGPHPLAISQPGSAAAASGPYPASDARVSTVPGPAPMIAGGFGNTDLTGGGMRVPQPKKPPIALFALGGVLLVALGGGGVWLAMRPSSSDAAALAATESPSTSSGAATTAAPGTATPDPPATGSAAAQPPSATPTNEPAAPASATTSKPATSSKPASAKPTTSLKPATTATPTATPQTPNRVGIGGTRQ